MPRLRHDDPDMTYACPCCNRGGNVYERTGNGHPTKDADRPFRCQKCSDTFTVVIERPTREPDDAGKAVWEHERKRILAANGLLADGD